MTPRATYRVQFHADFTFADAQRLAPYWAKLGVSHVYASPIATARKGSIHGYDVVDPTTINPALGGEEGFRTLVETLRRHDLGDRPVRLWEGLGRRARGSERLRGTGCGGEGEEQEGGADHRAGNADAREAVAARD